MSFETKSKPVVLVCDDDTLVRDTLVAYLDTHGFHSVEARDGVECLDVVQAEGPACIVLDLNMPRMGGLEVLQSLRERGELTPVLVLTGAGGVDSAITATQLGASDYLQKPVDVREVSLAVSRVLEQDRLKRRVSVLIGARRASAKMFVGRSPSLDPLLTDLTRLESVAAPTVLITGESGTGKDVLARTIHARGPLQDAIFLEVDCASLPEALVESELFGHERGAFTDAKTSKRGLFEEAGNGVLFLDEIGELPLASQAKLLRALESRTFRRVGGVATIRLDACVIAATNRDLAVEVEAGRFREDLFYRLNVVRLHVPPLRQRREDIPLLAAHFIKQFNERFGRKIEGVAPDAMEQMLAYGWPGNVRELKNVLERVAILSASPMIEASDLPAEVRYSGLQTQQGVAAGHIPLPPEGIDLAEVERGFVIQALEMTGGNRNQAAALLGITRFKLRNRIIKYGLE